MQNTSSTSSRRRRDVTPSRIRRFSVCCLDYDFAHIEPLLERALSGWRENFRVERLKFAQPMAALLEGQIPGGRNPLVGYFYRPRSSTKTSVMISNAVDGWYTLCGLLAASGGQSQILACSFGQEGATFHYWSSGKEIRTVSAILDGDSWEFFQRGEPLPFESVANYRRRKISTRLDQDLLMAYLLRLGWDLGADDYWLAHGDVVCVSELRG